MKPRRGELRVALVGCLAAFGLVNLPGQGAVVESVTGRVPLHFEQVGTGPEARFVSRAPGFWVEAAADGATLRLRRLAGRGKGLSEAESLVRWSWVGVDARPVGVPEQELPARFNYFHGRDASAWRTGVVTHARVRFAGVYRGIDVVFYGNDRQLEYDWVVAPGADPGRISFRVEGAESVRLTETGDLVLGTAQGELRQRRPVAFQGSRGVRSEVEVRFVLEEGEVGRVGIELGEYDRALPLVVDPVVLYSSYIGGGLFDVCRDVVVDGQGEVVVVGETTSTDLSVTNALFGTSGGGAGAPGNSLGNEAFVARFTADGSRMLFATYLGGSQIDAALAVALTGNGVMVGGLTHSPDYPVTTNAWSTEIHGEPFFGYYRFDGFLTELSPDGSMILFSTYLGGGSDDQVLELIRGPDNRLYAAGLAGDSSMALMTNLPLVVRSNIVFYGGEGLRQQTFVLAVAEDESSGYLRWISGHSTEFPLAMNVDGAGRVLVAGRTTSADLPTLRAIQGQAGGGADGYVGRLEADGGLEFLSYLGGGRDDEIRGVDVDGTGQIHLVGFSGSGGFPVTTNLSILSSTNRGGRDAFVVRLDATGTNLVYGTYVGGRGDDEATAVVVDPAGVATVAGVTGSADFPMVRALQSTNGGVADAFVFQLNAAGDGLDYSTYLGGEFADGINDLEAAGDGTWWLAGLTGSATLKDRWGATGLFAEYRGGASDGWLVRLTPADAVLEVEVTSGGMLRLSWPAVLTGFELQSNTNPGAIGAWVRVPEMPAEVGDRLEVTLAIGPGAEYYRLRRIMVE